MEAVTEMRSRKNQAGRKDATGQEAVIELDIVRNRLPELCGLLRTSLAANVELNEAIKACAEDSGLIAAALKRFVTARVKDKAAERRRDAAQICMMFDELGEA
jgi:hypothetical protein